MNWPVANDYHKEFGHEKFVLEAMRIGDTSLTFMHNVCRNQKCTYQKAHGPTCERRVRNAETCRCEATQSKIVHLVTIDDGVKTVVGDSFVKIEGDTITITATITDPDFMFRIDNVDDLVLGSLTNKVG